MVDLEDIAHRERRNVDLVADLVREGRLEHASIYRLLRLGDLARGDVDEIDAGFLERGRDLDRLVRRHALVADPVVRRDADRHRLAIGRTSGRERGYQYG